MATTITNKHGLDDVFVRAIMIDNHVTKGDISCTQLIDAPQIRILKMNNDIEEDVMDRISMLLGTAVHHVLERSELVSHQARTLLEAAEIFRKSGDDKAMKWLSEKAKEMFPEAFTTKDEWETTLNISIDGMIISGTFDKYIFDTKTIQDYKFTSTYAFIYEESKKKYYAQQNVYRYMAEKNGYEVKNCEVIGIFKDWTLAARNRSKDYPEHQVMKLPIPIQSNEVMEKYLSKRVNLHQMALNGDVPECTPKEMWATSDTFSVTTPVRKKSIRNFPKREMAEAFMYNNQFKYKNMFINFRPGERKRCKNYCSVSSVCPQYKKYKESLEE